MLSKLLRNTDWKQVRAFASPAFFEVMSARELYGRAREVRISKDNARYRQAVEGRARSLAQLPLAVSLPGQGAPEADALGEGRTADATRIVTLYFHQLFAGGPALLDLRGRAFDARAGSLHWDPAPWVCEFRDDFLPPLRDVYLGFYAGDDGRFVQGLRALNIEHAADLFRAHFGQEQSDQAFVMGDFVRTFHEVFVRCRDAGVKLHVDFLPLGVYLASLYDCLDGGDVRVDVRACFERATAQESESHPQQGAESGVHG